MKSLEIVYSVIWFLVTDEMSIHGLECQFPWRICLLNVTGPTDGCHHCLQ
jgi:hypothetical protein